MKAVPYASAVGSLIYAQVYTCPDLAFVTGMLGRYQKNPGKLHWDGVKKVLRYLQCTKGLMLTYKKSDAPLEIVGYSDSDFAGCLHTEKPTSGYIYIYTHKLRHIMEKLQTNYHYIVNDVRRVCCVL
jgi:hypothetical protein